LWEFPLAFPENIYKYIFMSLEMLSLYFPEDAPPCPPLVMAAVPVPAGFPSPATDYLEERIDLNRELVRNPAATFLARVRGQSMRDAGLEDGDLILIDRSRRPASGSLVLAWVDGGFTVKRLRLLGERVCLQAANPDYPDFELREDDGSQIWGVVTHMIKSCRP